MVKLKAFLYVSLGILALVASVYLGDSLIQGRDSRESG